LPFDETLARVRRWLEPDEEEGRADLKYDTHVLANHGIALAGIAHDTLLQSYVYESHRNHGLEDLARRHLGVEDLVSSDICAGARSRFGFDDGALRPRASMRRGCGPHPARSSALYPAIAARGR